MTDAIDLTTEQRTTLSHLLRRLLPGVAVWAYGSRVKWTSRPNSDLDLVAFTSSAQQPQVADLKEALAESNLPFPVDLHVWDEVPERFREIIRKEYVVVQEATQLDSKRGLAGEWTSRPLEDCMAALIDYRGKTPTKMSSGIPLITAKVVKGGRIETPDEFIAVDDYEPWMRRGLPKVGDVVITTEAPLGEVAQLGTERVALAQRLIALRGKEGLLDNGFLKFLMQSENVQDQLRARASGTTVLGIKQSELRKVMLTLPLIEEQRAIAHILGTLDDKIELNQKMNETLEAMAQGLFKSWFVDFDPVHAKAGGRDHCLPKPLADLFPDSFEDSELGEIPKGWRVGPILETAHLLSGGTPKTDRDEYWSGSIPWASAKDVSQCGDSFLIETERKITARGLDESATQLIPALCSVVVARGATTGRMVVLGDAMAINQTCYALATAIGTPFALYCHLREEIPNLVHAAHGSVFDTITTSTFATSKVVIPPNWVFGEFERRVDPMFRRVMAGTKASRTLAALRDALLPKLISGELRVRDAERFVEIV